MVDGKDDRRASIHPLPFNKHHDEEQAADMRSQDLRAGIPDRLLDTLHRFAEDMLDEPIPERLLEVLRKGQDAERSEPDSRRPAEKPER